MSTSLNPDIGALSAEDKKALLARLMRRQANQQVVTQPLSPGQKALWFLHLSAPQSPAYHVSFSADVHSEVNLPALRRAFQKIVDRHPMLRATFDLKDGEPTQFVRPEQEVCLRQHEVSGLDDHALHERVSAAYREVFDLKNGPLFRVDLFTRAATDHVLLITVHHIVYDAWSLWLNLDELKVLYEAELKGGVAQLPNLTFQHEDFVRLQQQRLTSPQGEQDWLFWQEQLAGDLPVINLPTDHPRPPVQSLRGASHAFAIDAHLLGQLKELAQQQGVTLFMLLLAAYQVMLHRYSGQDDILVGSPMSGRTHQDLVNVVGYFVNPVVLRARLSGDQPFTDFLAQVRQTVIGALEHQAFPFPTLVERLRPPRDASTSPIFQTLFVLQKERKAGGMIESAVGGDTSGRFDWGGLTLSYHDLPQQEGQFDLELELLDAGNALMGSFKYNVELFKPETIARMARNFEHLARSIVAQPHQAVDRLDVLHDAERSLVLDAWNDTATEYPFTGWMPERVRQQAQRTPDAAAVVFGSDCLSYEEFLSRVNQLAHHLIGLGVGPDVVVGVCLERSVDMVVALHAVQAAGGAYLPLDPEYPIDRIGFMASDADIALLLTHHRHAEACSEVTAPRLFLDEAQPAWSRQPATAPAASVSGENLAYVIYTSGSTGRPKGVAVPHKGFLNRIDWMQSAYRLGADDIVLQKTPFSFDVSVWEFFWPLMTGACLVVAQPGDHRDAERLIHTIESNRVTTLHFVPSMLRVFLAHPRAAVCTTIRQVFCSGEALPHDLQERFFEVSGAQLHNLYGPTEASIDVSHWTCQRNGSEGVVPIGVPIANTSLYVLDAHLAPVPIGVAGELHIGGVGLARGYLKREELTREKFIPDPFGHAPGGRLYKTGDLARFRADGAIEYLGRLDHQVKIRGFRIEIGEIETALLSHPSVDSVVVTVHALQGEPSLVAYLACGSTGAPSVADLRDFLRLSLPDHMIPALFVVLEHMPLSPNGKIDRKALPSPESHRAGPSASYLAPRNTVERDMAAIWQVSLGVERVGVQDNFFELGGHSLLAVGLMARIEQAFGRAMPIATLFRHPTVELLCQAMQASAQGDAVSTLVPVQPKGSAVPLFCPAGGGGSVLYYQPLAHHLGLDQPFYGLQAVGLDGVCEPIAEVEKLAELYVQEMRTVQPHGPYRIAGHCFGGLVAFEVAQQLKRAGEEIDILMLIDVPAKRPDGEMPKDDMGWLLKLADVIRESSGKDLGLNEATLRQLDAAGQLSAFREAMVSAGVFPPEAGVAQVRGLLRVFATNGATRYAPRDVQPLPIVVFRAAEFHPDYDFSSTDDPGQEPANSSMGWSAYAEGPVKTLLVPGNHITMMAPPHVEALAHGIQACLSELPHRPLSDHKPCSSTELIQEGS